MAGVLMPLITDLPFSYAGSILHVIGRGWGI